MQRKRKALEAFQGNGVLEDEGEALKCPFKDSSGIARSFSFQLNGFQKHLMKLISWEKEDVRKRKYRWVAVLCHELKDVISNDSWRPTDMMVSHITTYESSFLSSSPSQQDQSLTVSRGQQEVPRKGRPSQSMAELKLNLKRLQDSNSYFEERMEELDKETESLKRKIQALTSSDVPEDIERRLGVDMKGVLIEYEKSLSLRKKPVGELAIKIVKAVLCEISVAELSTTKEARQDPSNSEVGRREACGIARIKRALVWAGLWTFW
jgi:hypothetical protein